MAVPLLLGTWSFALKGIEAALPPLLSGGDPLDACELVCSTAERDEIVDSVGFGGFPDASGAVSLDASVMRSPRRNGSACCIREHLDATRIARLVMEETRHMMLVGPPTDALAESHGLPKSDLLAPSARKAWEQWQRDPSSVRQAPDTAFRPHDGGPDAAGPLFGGHIGLDRESRWRHHDTIGVLSLARDGRLAGACSTSGLPFKHPGRVGDSPIIGHGLYVEPGVGMAVATGEGEFIMGVCGTFAAIEMMRAGASPLEAAIGVLERVDANFSPGSEHQVGIITCDPEGIHATAALREGFRSVVGDADGVRSLEPDYILHPGT